MTLPIDTTIDFDSGSWTLVKAFDAGGSCTVFRAISIDGEEAAIKVHRPIRKGHKIPVRVRNEMNFSIERHPYIIAPKESTIEEFKGTRVVCLLLEFADHRELSEYITPENPTKKGLKKRLNVVKSMASAVEHLHNNDWIHGDISDRNFLLDKDKNEALLIDFESSVPISGNKEGMVWARREFLAPEVDLNGIAALSKKSDVWSLGLLLVQWLKPSIWQELKKKQGWQEIFNYRKENNLSNVTGTIIEQESPEGAEHVWEWLKKSLSIDSRDRPEVSELVRCLEND